MATVVTSPIYSANTAITFDVSSLATSSSFLAGRESTQIDNTTTLYDNIVIHCAGITGHASTAPVVGQMIQLYAWASNTSLATTALDTLVGADGSRTLTHDGIRQSGLAFAASAPVTVATAGLVHYFKPFSIRALFGLDAPPKFCGLFLAHNHAGSLAAAMSGKFTYVGITFGAT